MRRIKKGIIIVLFLIIFLIIVLVGLGFFPFKLSLIGFIITRLSVNSNATVIGDLIPPSITIISPENITYKRSLILVNISANDADPRSDVDSIWYDYGTGNITYTSPVIINLADGNYIFIAYANDTFGNTNSTNVIFVVDTTGDFSGTVKDLATSILIANVNVTVLNTSFSVITPNGIYNFTGVPKGIHTSTASAGGYLSQKIINHEIINGTENIYNFALATAGKIRGHIFDFFTSSGINNANVILIQFGNVLNSTLTNSSGYYEFSDLALGSYDLNITATGHTDNSKTNIQVSGNTTINLYIW